MLKSKKKKWAREITSAWNVKQEDSCYKMIINLYKPLDGSLYLFQ